MERKNRIGVVWMQSKRNIWGIVLLAVIVIMCVGGVFLYRKDKTAEMIQWSCFPFFGGASYSNDGIFWYGEEGISYQDAVSGKAMTICTKAGCNHQDKDCPAIVDGGAEGIIYFDDKINYIDSEETENRGLNLRQCDVNGENRKKIAFFSGIQQATALCYTENEVVVGYMNSMDLKKREQVDYREAGVYLYDRKTKKGKKLFQETSWNNIILSINIIDGMIYFSRSYNPMTEKDAMNHTGDEVVKEELRLCRMPVQGGKVEVIDNQINNSIAGVAKVGDEIVYSSAEGLQAYSQKTGKKKTVVKGDNISFVTNFLSQEQAIFLKSADEQKNTAYYSYKKGGKVEKMGETDIALLVSFDDTTYGMKDSGKGQYSILETKKCMEGDFKIKYNNGEE